MGSTEGLGRVLGGTRHLSELGGGTGQTRTGLGHSLEVVC